MEIRRLQLSDKDQMKDLIKEFLTFNREELLKGEVLELETISDWEGKLEEEFTDYLNEICFVAVQDNDLVGFITGVITERGHRKYNKRGIIEEFFVTKTFRNQGIGSKLFKTLIDELKNLKCDCVSVDAYMENSNAIEYYKKQGFIDWYRAFIKGL